MTISLHPLMNWTQKYLPLLTRQFQTIKGLFIQFGGHYTKVILLTLYDNGNYCRGTDTQQAVLRQQGMTNISSS
jgi:hypothetical protein